jgi:hypothetical protein
MTKAFGSFTDLIVSFMAGDAALYSHVNSLQLGSLGAEILLNVLSSGTRSSFQTTKGALAAAAFFTEKVV